MAYLMAAVGGALGALVRWGITVLVPASPGHWPWATFAVNLSGCLAIGVLLAVLPTRFPHVSWLRPLLAVGFLGGYTTFSTFAVESVRLADGGAWPIAAGYVVASVAGGAACVFAGLAAARAVLHPSESLLAELEAGEGQS
jgi:CrcB protein